MVSSHPETEKTFIFSKGTAKDHFLTLNKAISPYI